MVKQRCSADGLLDHRWKYLSINTDCLAVANHVAKTLFHSVLILMHKQYLHLTYTSLTTLKLLMSSRRTVAFTTESITKNRQINTIKQLGLLLNF